MKNVVKLILISALALVVVSCGNVDDSSDTEKETSSVSSINETDSSNESSETESFEVDSSETDSSKVKKVTTTVDDSSKIEKKTTTTTTTKKTTTQPVETTTTQPVETQTPITEAPKTTTTVKQTEAPKTTTTVKQTAKPTTTTTVKQTAKPTTTTTKTETVKKDKYQLAFEKVGNYNNGLGGSYTEADLKTIREYYINYAVSKFGARIRNCNKEFIPFYDTNGKLTHICTNDYVPATWQYYYGAEEINRVTYLIDGYLTEFLKNDSSDLTHTDYYWDVFWMIEPNTKSVYFSVAIF